MKRGPLTRENDGCQAVTIPESEDTFSVPSSHVALDQVDIAFNDGHAVASTWLLPATLAEPLGVEQVTDQVVDLGESPGAARPGRKLLTWCVRCWRVGLHRRVGLLGSGQTASVLGHRVLAASTVGPDCGPLPSGMSASSTQ